MSLSYQLVGDHTFGFEVVILNILRDEYCFGADTLPASSLPVEGAVDLIEVGT